MRIRSPHSASRTLSIMIRSSLVIFHCLLAKWTTAKSRPYSPAEISPFTFRTTSAGKQRGRDQGSAARELGRAGKTHPATRLSPQHSYLPAVFKQGPTAVLLPRRASLPSLKFTSYLYFRCWQSHTEVNILYTLCSYSTLLTPSPLLRHPKIHCTWVQSIPAKSSCPCIPRLEETPSISKSYAGSPGL